MGSEEMWGAPVNTGNFRKLGEGEGRVREIVGVLKDIEPDEQYSTPDEPKRVYVLELEGGEEVRLGDNAQLSALKGEHIGKLVRLVYRGTVKTKRGTTVKQIDVFVREGADMPAEFRAKFPSLS